MRKLALSFSALAIAAALAMTSSPARAITGTYVEDFEHPFVGLIAFYVADDGDTTDTNTDPDFSHRCSGSLLSPTVFLTAGHCTDETDADLVGFRIWFQQDAGVNYDPATQLDPITGYPEFCAGSTLGVTCATGTEMYNMGFDDFAGFPEINDVGVAILDQPITVSEYGELAAVGTLDFLGEPHRGQQDLTFTVSGYGLSYSSPVAVVVEPSPDPRSHRIPVMRSRWWIGAVCLWSLQAPLGSAERVPRLSESRPNIARVEWQKIFGQVEAKDHERSALRLRDRNGNVAHVVIDEHVQIFRNWRLVALDDVHLKDRIMLRRNVAVN